jgi:hypothetical protein
VPHYKPEDIIRSLYGYACGNFTTSRPKLEDGKLVGGVVYDCNIVTNADRGLCNYGQKKRNDIFQLFLQDADYQSLKFQDFSQWMISALLLAQFHYYSCLPMETISCTDRAIDPIFNQTGQELSKAITEASKNIAAVQYCFETFMYRQGTVT